MTERTHAMCTVAKRNVLIPDAMRKNSPQRRASDCTDPSAERPLIIESRPPMVTLPPLLPGASMNPTRRQVIAAGAITFAALSMQRSWAQSALRPDQDRIFICNEDSNTLAVIDPNSNEVVHTVNLTSFDEDPRPPFRLVTGGVTPTHLAMVRKPLYHGAIDIHGAAPSPDNLLIATTGRGTSNVYLIDAASLRVIGNVPNAQASDTTNKERITSGLLVGREPHEPTFTRNGRELWVTVRGEGRIAIFNVDAAKAGQPTERALRGYVETINGPAQVWFSKDGKLAFIASQKAVSRRRIRNEFR